MASVELIDIRKRFGPVQALDGPRLLLRPGNVHGVLGENGAGKTTLMNVLYGLIRPDSGQIVLDGKPADIRSPRDAIARGIGMVHQHFMLAGAMSVLDNILLGDRRALQILNRSKAGEEVWELSRRLGLEVDPAARVDELSVGQQQRLEIIKALYREAQVLILDEPTAVLTPLETEQLFSAVTRLRSEGKSIVFISHKLAEVKQICDELTILRRGKVVWEGSAKTASEEELAREMVGRHVNEVRLNRSASPTPVDIGESRAVPGPISSSRDPAPILTLTDIRAPGIATTNLQIGIEVLGIAGVDGNGQQELVETIVGLRTVESGSISLADRDITFLSVRERAALGVAHIPNDRKREGLVGSMTIAQNIALKHHRQPPFSSGAFMRWREVKKVATTLCREFDVRADSIESPVSTLSGGNQQKVILARELAVVPPKLIVAMNPVRGLDVAATNFVYQELLKRREMGCAILLISSELDELMRLCDRIAVIYRGALTMTKFPKDGRDEIGRLMMGLGWYKDATKQWLGSAGNS